MGSTAPGGATLRLFGRFAVLSLLPVVVLGALLAQQYRGEVERRGVEAGREQAQAIGRLLDEVVLDDGPLPSTLGTLEHERLRLLSTSETAGGHLARLRLRGADGRVVFADGPDAGASAGTPDDEALEALRGGASAEPTRLNADSDDSGPVGQRVVESLRAARRPAHRLRARRPRGLRAVRPDRPRAWTPGCTASTCRWPPGWACSTSCWRASPPG
ncbi:hypothetical protein GCM10025868_01870 [Angustibacter aerolatus]|uniref:Uncharacterized protein n=1 Tax=Angustibacter aerolatus TaxID=1162965 RepID=A0ABQ6JAY0_9ACTN|nr:hypothetical protein [Angustibacter aerolatus]GMA84937.1 hypothetical protein GCM10025868_01870 [Angustibacter aerolatus]